MTTRFSVVDPAEVIVLTFDFSAGLNTGETLVAPTVSVSVDYGTDPAASAIVKASQISGQTVLVQVSGMLDGVDYHLHCLCTTSNAAKTLMDAGVLPCRVL
jgi:hypothetical protein